MDLRIIGIFALFYIETIFGICMNSSLKTEKTEFGVIRRYCEYHVDENNKTVTLQIMPGSRFETRDCMECRCSDQGFKCCGIGINSRMFWVPDECRVVSNGCDPVIVLKANIYLDCFTKRPIQLKRKVSPHLQKQRALRRMIKQRRMQQRRMGQEVEAEGPNQGHPDLNMALGNMGNPLANMGNHLANMGNPLANMGYSLPNMGNTLANMGNLGGLMGGMEGMGNLGGFGNKAGMPPELMALMQG